MKKGFIFMNILETPRLILRNANADDAPFMLDLLNQPSFIRFIGDRGIRSLDGAREYIETRLVKSYKDNGFGLYITLLKEENLPIGLCGLVKRDGLDDIDIGFAFLAQHESKGYGFESASAVMEYSKNTLGLKRIAGITTPDNEKSIGLLEKLGLKFEKMIKLPNDTEELKFFIRTL